MDRVSRNDPVLLVVVVPAGIEVALEMREAAARDFNADAMARGERVARDEWRDVDLINFARLHEHRLLPSLTPPYPLDALVEVERFTIRTDIHQLDREIRVLDVRRQV